MSGARNPNYSARFRRGQFAGETKSELAPSTTQASETPWLTAESNLLLVNDDGIDTAGKWMVRFSKDKIDEKWEVVKQAVRDGRIHFAKVSCVDPKYKDQVIMITVENADDIVEVYAMYQTLIELGLIDKDNAYAKVSQQVKFKADQQTKNGVVDEKKVTYLYTSADMENYAAGKLHYLPNVMTTEPVVLGEGLPRIHQMLPSLRLADNIFSVKTGSTWRTNNPAFKTKTETADVFRAAVYRNGLPMAVLLDGSDRFARNAEIQQLADHVINTLADIVQALYGRSRSDEEVQKLVKEKYKELNKLVTNKYGSDASVSATAMYRNAEGKLMLVGFGTGDTMVVLKDSKSISTVIAARNDKDKEKPLTLPRQNLRAIPLDFVVDNLEIAHCEIAPGQQLVFMTDGAYDEVFETTGTELAVVATASAKSDIVPPTLFRRVLSDDQAAKLASITDIVAEADKLAKEQFDQKSSVGETVTNGDDATVAVLDIDAAIKAESRFASILCKRPLADGLDLVEVDQPEESFVERHSGKISLAIAAVLLVAVVVLGVVFFPPLLTALPFLGKVAAAVSTSFLAISAEVVLGALIGVAGLAAGAIGGLLAKAGFARHGCAQSVAEGDESVAEPAYVGPAGISRAVGAGRDVEAVPLVSGYSATGPAVLSFGPAAGINGGKQPAQAPSDGDEQTLVL